MQMWLWDVRGIEWQASSLSLADGRAKAVITWLMEEDGMHAKAIEMRKLVHGHTLDTLVLRNFD